MSVPEWMMPPPPDHPDSGGPWFPHVISQTIVGDGTVLVTWALPNLQTATVRVPVDVWIDGHHAPTGAFLASFASQLPGYDPAGRRPDQDGGDDG